jgi:hypothetical protein
MRPRLIALLAWLFTLSWLLLAPARVEASAPTFDNVSSGGANNSASISFSHTVGGTNRYLACGVAVQNGTKTVSSITFNGIALTQLTSMTNTDDVNRQSRAEYWYLINPPATTATVVVTLNSATAVAAGCVSYTNVDQSTPHGTPATAKGDGATTTVVVSSAVNEVVLDVTSIRVGTVGVTEGAGQTNRVEKQSAAGVGNATLAMSSEDGAASVTMSWTVDDATAKAWTAIGVSLKGTTPPPPTGTIYTVCASGCVASNAQLQLILDGASCGDSILLEALHTYTGPSATTGYVMKQRCTTAGFDGIVVRTGVNASGTILPLTLFPGDTVRTTATYYVGYAELKAGVNNGPAIRTEWPSEEAACAPSCVASNWTLKWLAFGPKADWLKGKLVWLGSNKAASDPDLPSGNAQDLVSEVPDYLSVTQCYFHGDPIAGADGGLYYSAKNGRITGNVFVDFKSMHETQAITFLNWVGPVLVENNYIEATGENTMSGGGDSKMQQHGTISGTPTSTVVTIDNTLELYNGEWVGVSHLGNVYSVQLDTFAGSVLTFASALPFTPSVGDVVSWTRIGGGLTVRYNWYYKRPEWRNDVIAVPTNVGVTCLNTGGSLATGSHYYKVAGRRLMFANADADAESAASIEVVGTVGPGGTGSCTVTFTESPGNTGGTYIFHGTTAGNETTRYSVSDGITFFTDTGNVGTADTPRSTGDTYVVKNNFELKHCEGGGPAGPCLIEYNVFDYSWCCSQQHLINLKSWNQNGGDVSAVVRNLTFRYNWGRHAPRFMTLAATDTEFHPTGVMSDVLVENNLATDMTPSWGGSYTALFYTIGNYTFRAAGGRAMRRVTFNHNTILHDPTTPGPIWFNISAGEKLIDFVYTNNIARNGTNGLRTFIDDQGQTFGTTSWNAAVQGSSSAAFNVWGGASAGSYGFSTASFFPPEATLRGAFVDANACDAGTITGCALTGASQYDSAGSDGLDIGADIAAIKTGTDIALSGVMTVDLTIPTSNRPRLRVRIR